MMCMQGQQHCHFQQISSLSRLSSSLHVGATAALGGDAQVSPVIFACARCYICLSASCRLCAVACLHLHQLHERHPQEAWLCSSCTHRIAELSSGSHETGTVHMTLLEHKPPVASSVNSRSPAYHYIARL
jgi:hypothetical protein